MPSTRWSTTVPSGRGTSSPSTVTYTEIYERSGRSGRLLFRVRESVLSDQRGERIGVTRSGHVYAYNVAGEAASPAPAPPRRAPVTPAARNCPR